MRAILTAAGASAVAAGLGEVALVLGAERLDSKTRGAPGAGIALAGFILLAFVLVVPLTSGLAGGLASREPHAVIGSVAGLYGASLVGLLLAGARVESPSILPVLLGIGALSVLTVIGHFLAIAIRVPAVQR